MSKIIEPGKIQMEIPKPKFKRERVIPEEVAVLLVDQIGRELYNHNLYNTFSSYFSMKGLFKLQDYYEDRATEEYNHHNWIAEYLKDCVVPFGYPQVNAIEVEIPNELSPFEQTVQAEIETTEWINNIYKKASELNDQQTKKWLTKLIMEQVEEEQLSLKVLQLAQVDTDWITKANEILEFYEKE